MKHIILLLVLTLAVISLKAQESNDSTPLHRLVVADIETRVPMRGVIVSTKTGYRDTTNWRGICYVPAKFDTLTIYKHSYIPERLVQRELRDSTYLIPEGSSIGQVTIWGKNHVQDNVKEWKRYTPLPNPSSGGAAFDFAKLLDRRYRHDQKHLKNVRQKFREMDTTGDPIVDAYNKALEEAKLKKEEEEKEKEQTNNGQKEKGSRTNNGNQINKDRQNDKGNQVISKSKNNTQEEKK